MPRTDPLNRSSRLVVLAAICVVTAALYFAQPVLVPLALAIVLSFLLNPLVTRLERLGAPRVVSVIAVVLLLFAILGGIGWIVGQQIGSLAENVPAYEKTIRQKIQNLPGSGMFERWRQTAQSVENIRDELTGPATTQAATQPTTTTAGDSPPPPDIAEDSRRERTMPELGRQPEASRSLAPVTGAPTEEASGDSSSLTTVAGLVLGPLGTAGIVLVFVIFMLIQREDLRDRVIRLVGGGQLQLTTQALDDASHRISRYLIAVSIVNGSYGVAIALGLWAIGFFFGQGQAFPSVVLWGLLCALLRFIPYVGPWIAAAFPMVIAVAAFPGFSVFAATVVMFVVIELLSNNFMEPLLYGSSTGISTVAVLVSAVFWTWLWGPIGLVLATPLTVCLVVIGKYVPQLQFLDIMLGDQPVLEPAEKVYQRLLAMDSDEVSDLIDNLLETQSLEEVYDKVLIPALAMAEEDRHRGRLDDQRHKFIRQAMRDLIEELGDRHRGQETRAATARTVEEAQGKLPAAAENDGKSAPVQTTVRRIPKDCVVNVLCLPSHDEADAIVAMMLAQLLEMRGFCAHYTSVDSLASEMVELVEKKSADIACISALPPAAIAHARYLCKRLRGKFEDLDVVIGLWTFKGEVKRAAARIACDDKVGLATTLAQALEQIHQAVQPLLMKEH